MENKEICEKYKVLAGVVHCNDYTLKYFSIETAAILIRWSISSDLKMFQSLMVINLLCFKLSANLDDSALDECFRNVNVVYLIPSSSGRRVKQMENCIEAAKRSTFKGFIIYCLDNVNFILLFSNIRLQDLKLTKIDRDYSKMEEM